MITFPISSWKLHTLPKRFRFLTYDSRSWTCGNEPTEFPDCFIRNWMTMCLFSWNDVTKRTPLRRLCCAVPTHCSLVKTRHSHNFQYGFRTVLKRMLRIMISFYFFAPFPFLISKNKSARHLQARIHMYIYIYVIYIYIYTHTHTHTHTHICIHTYIPYAASGLYYLRDQTGSPRLRPRTLVVKALLLKASYTSY